MVQNNTVSSGNVPKWGQYPVGVFPGCNTKTLRKSRQEVSGIFNLLDEHRTVLRRVPPEPKRCKPTFGYGSKLGTPHGTLVKGTKD